MKDVVRRAFMEHRAAALPLAIGLIANLGVYILAVRPLEKKSAGAAGRAVASRADLKAAQADFDAARALTTGKARAEQELTTFYEKVIPPDLSTARRMTYATLPALAQKANVHWDRRRFSINPAKMKDARLGHLRIEMTLQGDYENVRQFIYDLETAQDFVIIDDVTLAENTIGRGLTVAVALSTYYRLGANGT